MQVEQTTPVNQIKPDMNREKEILYINISDIIPNRFQPRLNFDQDSLKDLADSIKQHGVIQPLVVRELADKYEIIAGERRYKASTMAGLQALPVVVVHLSDIESAEVALIENIQRKDLTPIEEAKSYQRVLDLGQMTQEQLAVRMGKSQATIANKLRLLGLSPAVQEALMKEQISERHARSLLSIKDPVEQEKTLKDIINKRMTVRQTDELICSRIVEPSLGGNPMNQTPQPEPTPVPEITPQPASPEVGIPELASTPAPTLMPEPQVMPEIPVAVPVPTIPTTPVSEIPVIDPLIEPTSTFTTPEPTSVVPESIPSLPPAPSIESPGNIPSLDQPVHTPEPMPNIDDLLRVDTAPRPMEPPPIMTPEPIPELIRPIEEPPVPIGSAPTSSIPVLGTESITNPFSNVPETNIPIVEPVISNIDFDQEPAGPVDPNFIAAGDLRAAVNSVRATIKTIEKYGFKVETEELDLEKQYQITIKIDKPY